MHFIYGNSSAQLQNLPSKYVYMAACKQLMCILFVNASCFIKDFITDLRYITYNWFKLLAKFCTNNCTA